MLEELIGFIRGYFVFQTQSRSEVKEPTESKNVPHRPWEVTDTDHFECN